jgi:hypothetical protein
MVKGTSELPVLLSFGFTEDLKSIMYKDTKRDIS